MQVHTFELEDDYALIGIHSTEEDYRLAYLLNKHLNTKLKRFKESLDFENSTAEFPLFEYIDNKKFINYYLINNTHLQFVDHNNKESLFGGNYNVTYLIPEKKNVDYFLKIEGSTEQFLEVEIVKELKKISQIIASYPIDLSTLKSKNNLIF